MFIAPRKAGAEIEIKPLQVLSQGDTLRYKMGEEKSHQLQQEQDEEAQPADQEEHDADPDVGEDHAHPDLHGERVHEGEHSGSHLSCQVSTSKGKLRGRRGTTKV